MSFHLRLRLLVETRLAASQVLPRSDSYQGTALRPPGYRLSSMGELAQGLKLHPIQE
jgi:hypothetical protein